ncbi:hypothetical protein P154DRAFT_502989 [Amniculicola lignicola CBS 123094]|uniref:Sensitive to high expression protein 9, mitochondrial n=1 Tax=Amniculicola lignicola CBS 123094 TaxID=1392246 RepID=A0A6A5VV93_9PLEO|nr:hypothetical protein P154DRAFT_502989 [Amniculicola lignicola CBS 123094]
MRPLLQHASRAIGSASTAITSRNSSTASSFASIFRASANTPSICVRCQFQTASPFPTPRYSARRPFSTSRVALDRSTETPTSPSSPNAQPPTPLSPVDKIVVEPTPKKQTPSPKQEPIVHRVPTEDLPSHSAQKRWNLSKRFTEFMDDLLPRIAVVTHKVNMYTGTDYSGIESLRREIKEQEQLVRVRHGAVLDAKNGLDAAQAQQAASQKEVVALLERKHSWTAQELERYMALIRSEHINDQAVREAKDAVMAAESSLEEARIQLEKRERAQYHEEQIWSDTIRRNSTWVTFGLMGVNIVLLLASLLVFEPWRRRRIVREIKSALEAQKSMLESPPISVPVAAVEAVSPVETIAEPVTPVEPAKQIEIVEVPQATAQNIVQESIQEKIPDPSVIGDLTQFPTPLTPAQAHAVESLDIQEEVRTSTMWKTWPPDLLAATQDLISERSISLRKIDLTIAICQGAAAGAVITGALIMFLVRPH